MNAHHELVVNMQKFVVQIENAVRQVDGEIHLTKPKLPFSISSKNLKENINVRFLFSS